MRRILRRQNENGLGEIEFARDRLHQVALEPFAVQDDGERIAGKAAAGENIERYKMPAHQVLLPAVVVSFKAAVSPPSPSPSSATERRPKPSLNTRASSPNQSPLATLMPFAAAAP
jgi:hypothetical protein